MFDRMTASTDPHGDQVGSPGIISGNVVLSGSADSALGGAAVVGSLGDETASNGGTHPSCPRELAGTPRSDTVADRHGDTILISRLAHSVLHGVHEMRMVSDGPNTGRSAVSIWLHGDHSDPGAYALGKYDLIPSSLGKGMSALLGSDQPTQIPIGTPIALVFIAGALLFLPSILGDVPGPSHQS